MARRNACAGTEGAKVVRRAFPTGIAVAGARSRLAATDKSPASKTIPLPSR
jgi:hypothetical protein